MAKPKREIDWEAIETQYRAGIRSLKDIGAEFGVSDAGIIKKARRDEWVRDLKGKIRAKADAKVSAAVVSAEVSALTKASEAQVIEVEAQVQARIRISHRTDIARFRRLALELLGELESETASLELFEQLGDILRSEDKNGIDRRNDIYRKVISSAGRVDSLKKLSETLKHLIGLEREAYGIASDDKPAGDGDDLNSTLAKLIEKLPG